MHARFRQTDDYWKADLVVFRDVPANLETAESLVCRLRGIRAADRMWLLSNGRKGTCLAFQQAAFLRLHLWVTQDFRDAFPKHSALLFAFAERAGLKAQGRSVLHVYTGSMPEKPKHPRLSFELVLGPDIAHQQQLTLQGLLKKLSVLHAE